MGDTATNGIACQLTDTELADHGASASIWATDYSIRVVLTFLRTASYPPQPLETVLIHREPIVPNQHAVVRVAPRKVHIGGGGKGVETIGNKFLDGLIGGAI